MMTFLVSLMMSVISMKSCVFFLSGFMVSKFCLGMLFVSWLFFYYFISGSFWWVLKKDYFSTVSFFMLVVLSVSMCFVVDDSFLFLFFLEICVLPMFILILSLSKDYDKLSSCLFMVFLNNIGSIPFMLYWAMTSEVFKPSSFMECIQYFNSADFFIFFCYFFLLASKLPVFLLHFWLTKAHVASSGACSMILASLMLKLGSFGLLKYSSICQKVSLAMVSMLISLSLVSCMIFCLLMIRFLDMKNLVACSSIMHMSFLLPFCVYLKSAPNCSSVLMMMGHGVTSLVLFFIVSFIYEACYSRSFDLSKSLESVSKSLSLVTFIYFCLNMAVPPFVNFISELLCCFSVISLSIWFSVPMGFVMVFYTIFFMFFSTKNLFSKKVAKFNSMVDSVSINLLKMVFISLMLPLLLCFFSLFKMLLCGSKENKAVLFSVWSKLFFAISIGIPLIFWSTGFNLFWCLNLMSFDCSMNIGSTLTWWVSYVPLVFVSMLMLVSFIVMLYSEYYLDGYNSFKFFSLASLFVSSMILLSFSGSKLVLMLGWDYLGLTSICLIMFYPNKYTLFNSFLTMMFNRMGDVLMIFCLSFMIFNFYDFYIISVKNLDVLILMVICSFTKSAQMPLSCWLPAAMSAPTPISAMVHSSTLVTAGIFLISTFFFDISKYGLMEFIIVFNMITFLIGGLMASLDKDLKKVIAFSTMSQISMILLFCCMSAVWVSMAHMLFHASFKSLLFSCAGMIFGSIFMDQYLSKSKVYRMAPKDELAMLFISCFGMSGLYFSSSFFSKDLMLELLMDKSLFYFVALWLGSILTSMYLCKLFSFTSMSLKSNFSSSMKNVNSYSFKIYAGLSLMMGSLISSTAAFLMAPVTESLDLYLISAIITLFLLVQLNVKSHVLLASSLEVGFMKWASFSVLNSLLTEKMKMMLYSDQLFFKPFYISVPGWNSSPKFGFSMSLISLFLLLSF